jgi:hypothetical protein
MTPVYGFLAGDSIGILVLAQEEDTMERIADKLKQAASVRVRPRAGGTVYFQGRPLEPRQRLRDSGMAALDRFDLRWEES